MTLAATFAFPAPSFGIHPPGAPQMDIARLVALSPGGHPVGVGLGALFALFDLLHLPNGQILEPGLELEGLGISSIIIPVITSKLQTGGHARRRRMKTVPN